MKSITLLLAAPLLLILTLNVGLAEARPGKVATVAQAELAKRPAESNGNNVPRYRNGQRAPYAARSGGLPWSGTFASIVLQRAGYKKHLQAGTIRVVGGRAVGYTGAFTALARKEGKLRQQPRRGYLAMFGTSHMGIVSQVSNNGRGVTVISGNCRNTVCQQKNPRGITHYIAPF